LREFLPELTANLPRWLNFACKKFKCLPASNRFEPWNSVVIERLFPWWKRLVFNCSRLNLGKPPPLADLRGIAEDNWRDIAKIISSGLPEAPG
jgi:hypothetical protein